MKRIATLIVLTALGWAFSTGVAFARPPVDVETWGDVSCAQARQEMPLTSEDTCTHIPDPGPESTWESGWHRIDPPRDKNFEAIFGGDESSSSGSSDPFPIYDANPMDDGGDPFPITTGKDFGAIFGGS